MANALARFTQRSVLGRPGRAVLTLLSIVIGVSSVVAVKIVTATTDSAYRNMFATVMGRASLEVAAEGGGSFPDQLGNEATPLAAAADGQPDRTLVANLEAVPGVEAAVPVIMRPAVLFVAAPPGAAPAEKPKDDEDGEAGEEEEKRRIRLYVIGIDPQRDSAVRDYELTSGRALADDEDLHLDAGFAHNLGVKVGDTVKLLTKKGVKELRVVGLVTPRGGGALKQAGLVFMKLTRAQYLFAERRASRSRTIDSIQIVLKPGVEAEQVREPIAALLPEGTSLRKPASDTQVMQETLLSSQQGLRIASAFSVLMAAFIILNTFLMNVGERRRQLAIIRAIGGTRKQLMKMILGEAALMGLVGTAIGVGAGVALAWVAKGVLARTLQVPMESLHITAAPFLWAAGFGLGAAIIGAAYPAWRAGSLSPVEGMRGVMKEDLEGFSWKFIAAGLILVVTSLSIILAIVDGKLDLEWSIWSGMGLLIGVVMLSSLVLAPLSSFVAWLLRPFMRVEAGLALRQVLRHRMRSSLTIAVLFVAGSTGVGMASSILDNVKDVQDWYRRAIVGDFFIRAMMPDMATGLSADLPEEMDAEIRRVPGISELDSVHFAEAHVGEQRVIVIAREFSSSGPPNFDLVEGDITRVRDQLFAGEVVIGTVVAQRLGLKAGDELSMETREGTHAFPIAAVTNEYMVGGLSVYMQRKVADHWLHTRGTDGYIVRAPAPQREAVRERLQALAEKHGALVHSFADISSNIDRIISGIDAWLWLLVYVGFIVAAFGVVNTLTMNVLEQTRELGMLRIVAMTRSQVRKTIFTQALIIGGVGLAPGILAGVAVAWLMNQAMLPALGHPVEFGIHPLLLLGTWVGAMAIVLAAAWFPARRAAGLNVVDALHYE